MRVGIILLLHGILMADSAVAMTTSDVLRMGADKCDSASDEARNLVSLAGSKTMATLGLIQDEPDDVGQNETPPEEHLNATCKELRNMAGETVKESQNITNETAGSLIQDPDQPAPGEPNEPTAPVIEGPAPPLQVVPPVEDVPVAEPLPDATAGAAPADPVEIAPPPAEERAEAPEPVALAVSAADPASVVPESDWPLAAGMAVTAVTAAGLALGPSAFYNRLTKDRVTTNRLRKRLFELVCERPGGTSTDLARVTGVDRKTVVHHLRMLARFGHVVVYSDSDGPRFFENHGHFPEGLRRAVACLHRRGTRDFLDAIRSQRAASLADVARLLGISVSTAGYRAARLTKAGLLARKEGRWTVTDQAQQLLAAGRAVVPGSETGAAS